MCAVSQRKVQDLRFVAVPRLSALLPIFFNVVSRFRNSFGLALAKTLLVSAVCLRKTGAINSLPFDVRDTMRTRRSTVTHFRIWSGGRESNPPPQFGKGRFELLGSGLLPFCGRVHFLVHSWSNNCYLGSQSAVLVAIRAA